MARPLRIEYPGAVYHVTSRGNAGQKIFRSDKDREYILELLAHLVERFRWSCHAYCLMDNHYHLVIETSEANLSRGMRQLNGAYTQRYNWKYRRSGHVFQGRYKAILVDKESYLLELCRYVVLNPMRAHLVEKPEDWKWSSYLFTAGLKKSPEFLTTDWVLGQFSPRKKMAQNLYRLFVVEGITKESPWKDLKGQIFLGDKEFLETLKMPSESGLREIPRLQSHVLRPGLQELFANVKTKAVRDERIFTAHVTHAYRLKEIADHLHVHYATVSRAVKRIESKMHDCKT